MSAVCPKGLDTVIGEQGGKLSGGQRQRLAIARALVRSPSLLVLDEVTTSLDPATEREICATLRSLTGQITVLAISHQPAVVSVSDIVLRVENGKVMPGKADTRRAMALSEKSKPMNVFLDVQEMEFDENGVKNFFWPISRSEFDSARDALLSGIAKAAKAQGNTLDGERDLFATFCHFVCYEALACYQAYALNRRTTSAGHKLVWRKNSRLFPLISDGRAPRVQESELVRTLHNGPRCHPWYLRPLVKLRRTIRWNGFNFHGLRPARPQGDIIACHATEVLEYHAQAVPETVKYTLFGEWFSPINQGG